MKRLGSFLFFVLCILAMLFAVGVNYSESYGFTRLIGFGEHAHAKLHPALEEAGVYVKPGTSGYDSQYYAPLVCDPSLSDPQLQESMDGPSYRARRIGLPFVAWLIGGDDLKLALNVFSLLNVVAWLWLAFYLRQKLGGLHTGEDCMRWFACMFAVGTLDSVRLALTDLPGAMLVVMALYAFEKGTNCRGILYGLLAVFVKETSVLVFGAKAPNNLSFRDWARYAGLCVMWGLPFALWIGYVMTKLPAMSGVEGNFNYPFVSMYAFGEEVVARIAEGRASIHDYFGLSAIASGVLQVFLCVRYFKWSDIWWRVAMPFALIFVLSGYKVWASTMAPLRIVLPMTLIVCLKVPKRAWFYPAMFIITLPTIHGVIRWIYNL